MIGVGVGLIAGWRIRFGKAHADVRLKLNLCERCGDYARRSLIAAAAEVDRRRDRWEDNPDPEPRDG